MSVVNDSSSLGPMSGHSYSSSEVFLNHQRLSELTNAALYELDDYEAISMVFLLLDVECLTRQGYNYCQYITNGQQKDIMDHLITFTKHTHGSLTPVIEALYLIGRYDLLEDRLNLMVNQKFKDMFSNRIDDDRRRLYFVFSGMAQNEADRIISARLTDWHCPEPDRPLEETFARNLHAGNYHQLITSLYKALMDEGQETLALFLHPLIRPRTLHSPQSEPLLLPSWNEETTYTPPTHYPHGFCIIINVKSFMKPRDGNDTLALDERHGSDIDKERLTGTFKLFGFYVKHLDNPDHEKIKNYFKGLRTNPGLVNVSCLVVCVMTHGDEQDNIYLHDRACIAMTDLRKLCFSEALLNKPRLYFIQACRGEQPLRPILLQKDSTTVAHPESHCLISAATVKGYSAIRSQIEGSWYISDICQALQEFGHIYPIKTVLQKARNRLMERVGNMNCSYVTQLSEDKDTLLKDVQFKRADEQHFIEGIIDLVQLEVVEGLIEDLLEGAFSTQQSYSDQYSAAQGIASVTDELSSVHLT